MSYSSVEVYAKEYFHNLNPIAHRISSDVSATREAYEDLWITLSYKDQRQVLDEAIIHPEAVLKYSFSPRNQPEEEYFPCLRIQTGEKYVFDDEGGKGKGVRWRDEHSAPFSFMTRSQLNLAPSGKLPVSEAFIDPPSLVLGGSALPGGGKLKSPQDGGLLRKLKSNTAVLKIQALRNKLNDSSPSELEALVPPSRGKSCRIQKPKTPPPAPPKPAVKATPPAPPKPAVKATPPAPVKPAVKATPPAPPKPAVKATSPAPPKPAVKTTPPAVKTPPPAPPKPSVKCAPPAALKSTPPRSVKATPPAPPIKEVDVEKRALLQESPGDEMSSASATEQVSVGSMESLQEFHSALNSPTSSEEPRVIKTGFDFLDNW